MSSRRILAQLKPAATTLVELYKVPLDKSANIAFVTIANQDASSATFRLSLAMNDAADSLEQYMFYDTNICPNETICVEIRALIDRNDAIRVYSSSGNLSFTVLGDIMKLILP